MVHATRVGVARLGMLMVFAGLALPARGGVVSFETIALTGTDGPFGPGMGAGVTFTQLNGQQPTVNSSGHVAFRGNPTNLGGAEGMWIHNGMGNTNMAIGGGAQPGGGTYTAGTSGIINSTHINDAGQWAFRLGGSTGLFANVTGTPGRTMLIGDMAPGTGGATYTSSASGMPLFNGAGMSGYVANLAVGTGSPPVVISGATANAKGLWVGTPGASNLVVRQNDAVLSLDAGGGVRVGSFNDLSVSMNASGAFAFSTALQGSVTTGSGAGGNSVMIATTRSGSLEVLARNGNAAPDATGADSPGDLYRTLSTSAVAFNNAGKVAFTSSLRNAAGTQTFSSALFTDTGTGAVHMAGRATDALPAISNSNSGEFAGVTWSSFSNPVMNGAGTLALTASLSNTGATTNTGVLLTMDASGAFSKVARAGDVAILNGAPLGGDARFTSFSSIALNDGGQMAFSAILNGAGIFGGPGGNNSAIFGFDPLAGIHVLARTNDVFEVAPGDFRVIASLGGIGSSGGQDGRLKSLNSNGQLAFELSFTDGSTGIFLATVPGVGTLPLLGLAGLAAARRRRA